MTLVFDMMENQPLPKSDIGEAYYARQLHLYVFGVVRHRGSGGQQGKEDILFYTWLECQNRKNSNMIVSALKHCLDRLYTEIRNSNELRLFSDSAFGQNKNWNMVSMLGSMRKKYFPNTSITHTFPERGHSFLPADRAFGRLSQDLKKHERLYLPESYYSVLERHGQVLQYGKDWEAYDYTSLTSKFIPTKKPFAISTVKRIQIDGDTIQEAPSYTGGMTRHTVFKKGKNWGNYRPLFFLCAAQSRKKRRMICLPFYIRLELGTMW